MTKRLNLKRGKPPWIPPDPEKVESLAARGLTMEQIANCLGIHEATLYHKRHDFTEFDQALKRGKSKGISIVANALFEAAKKGNITAQIFYLKARAQWYDISGLDSTNTKEETLRKIRQAKNEYKK